MVIVNLYSIQMDPNYWGDPEVFRPERFLNPDGSFRKDERHIPFGKGIKSHDLTQVYLPFGLVSSFFSCYIKVSSLYC